MAYRVIWEIDIDADSPEDAAKQARAAQLDVDSIAKTFEVNGTSGTPGSRAVHVYVDLEEWTRPKKTRVPRSMRLRRGCGNPDCACPTCGV